MPRQDDWPARGKITTENVFTPLLDREQGDDPRLLDFQIVQCWRKGNAIATEEQLERIGKVPKREFMRRGINHHTLEKICKREPVRAVKLAKCLRVLEEHESENNR